MLDSIHQMTLKLPKVSFNMKRFCHFYATVKWALLRNFTKSVNH